ncbi:MAG: DUF892 family protein [Bacteroidetes bacterium]|nr:DUF892 family protein [Bacteroidota bacterium]
MKNNNEKITTLQNLLDYDAQSFAIMEVQLQHILPSWISKASSFAFKEVLQGYLDKVEQNVKKLDEFIEEENISSLSIINIVMNAFIGETELKLAKCTDTEVRDASLLACVQAINHYKISVYGTAATFAVALEKTKAATLFHEAGTKEKEIDEQLSRLAEYDINVKAKAPIVLPA